MKLIYICGPFRAETYWAQEQNVRVAEDAAVSCWRHGFAVICPHANTRFFQGAVPDKVWLEGDLEIVRRCDALYLVDGWQHSEGASGEIELAGKLGIPVFSDFGALLAWGDAHAGVSIGRDARH